jgi:polyphosphate kinase
MNRNLESRVEVLVPVDDAFERQALKAVLDLQLAPNRNSWQMQSDGTYVRTTDERGARGCQQALLDWIAAREAAPLPTPEHRHQRRIARRNMASRLG